MESDYKITSKGFEREKTIKDALCTINLDKNMAIYGPELLNVSIRRIRLNSRILLNKQNRRKFNL